MSNIRFGSQVYTWFMQEGGAAYDNKLDHMIRMCKKSGFVGIEPMVLTPLENYWLGDLKDPARLKDVLGENDIELAAFSLVCGWENPTETDEERAAADYAIETLKLFPGAKLCTVPLPSNRKNLCDRRMNLAKNVNEVSRRAVAEGLECTFHPNSPPASVVRTPTDYDVVLNSIDPSLTGWTPDVGHIIRGGMDVIACLNKWPHMVNHIHFKDFSGNGPEPWAKMGTGKLDFHQITEWLVAHDYQGWIICEDECEEAIGDPDGVTLQNAEWCKANLYDLV
jgi:inosose dehydratase